MRCLVMVAVVVGVSFAAWTVWAAEQEEHLRGMPKAEDWENALDPGRGIVPTYQVPPAQPKGTPATLQRPKGGGTAPAPVKAEPRRASANILFAYDSAELTPTAREQLDELAKALQGSVLAGYICIIEGHTDAVGSEAYNEDLSRRRAEAVVDYMVVERGVDRSRLSAVGKGESELLDPQHPTAAVNRRVAVFNTAQR